VDVGAPDDVVLVEEDLDVLTETAGVLVAHRLAVAECLEERIAGQDLALNRVVLAVAERGQQLHAVLGGLGLARPALPRNHNGLLRARFLQRQVGPSGHQVDVRLVLAQLAGEYLLLDGVEDVLSEEFVDGAVGVDDDEGGPDAGEDLVLPVPAQDVAQHFRLVQHAHLAHVREVLLLRRLEGLVHRHLHPHRPALRLQRTLRGSVGNRCHDGGLDVGDGEPPAVWNSDPLLGVSLLHHSKRLLGDQKV
jgi:hypothetical protein